MTDPDFPTMALDFEKLRAAYPTYNKLPPHIAKYMDDLNKGLEPGQPRNTPCCFQVSEALNAVGGAHKIPERSYRRANAQVAGNRFLGAVDELEYHLAATYGKGFDIKPFGKGEKHPIAAMKAVIAGRSGILAFRDGGYGAHTELWDGTDILQNGAPASNGAALNQSYIFGRDRVLFWQASAEIARPEVPQWLQGWWDVDDGQQYYYHFSKQNVVTYMKVKPNGYYDLPAGHPGNQGSFTVDDSQLAITWLPSGDGITKETFQIASAAPILLYGASNRFGPLRAQKILDWSKKK